MSEDTNNEELDNIIVLNDEEGNEVEFCSNNILQRNSIRKFK